RLGACLLEYRCVATRQLRLNLDSGQLGSFLARFTRSDPLGLATAIVVDLDPPGPFPFLHLDAHLSGLPWAVLGLALAPQLEGPEGRNARLRPAPSPVAIGLPAGQGWSSRCPDRLPSPCEAWVTCPFLYGWTCERVKRFVLGRVTPRRQVRPHPSGQPGDRQRTTCQTRSGAR